MNANVPQTAVVGPGCTGLAFDRVVRVDDLFTAAVQDKDDDNPMRRAAWPSRVARGE
jgi:hypothetical protein